MLDTVKINHVQHISFTQSRLTDAVSVILSELLSYEHPPKDGGFVSIMTENGRGLSPVSVETPKSARRSRQHGPPRAPHTGGC